MLLWQSTARSTDITLNSTTSSLRKFRRLFHTERYVTLCLLSIASSLGGSKGWRKVGKSITVTVNLNRTLDPASSLKPYLFYSSSSCYPMTEAVKEQRWWQPFPAACWATNEESSKQSLCSWPFPSNLAIIHVAPGCVQCGYTSSRQTLIAVGVVWTFIHLQNVSLDIIHWFISTDRDGWYITIV